MSGGAGTIAEKVTAGSVPIATATSIFPDGRSPSARTLPPELRAIMSTAADFPSTAARIRSRACSAATFCLCQCIPVVRSSYTCIRYMPTLRLPDLGSRVVTHGSVMNRPGILRPALQDREVEQREIVPLDHFLARPSRNRPRKKLAHLRSATAASSACREIPAATLHP